MDSLPEELLLQIIERVIELPRTSHWVVVLMRRTLNLHPLVLVSKKFNRIVAPLLYETIRCPYWRTDTFWQNIVNTLRSNPGLARYVKSIETPNTQPLFKNMAPEDLRSILPFDLVSNLYHQSLREFNKRSKHGDNVMLTFLVLESPNLKSLDLRGFERAYRNDVKLLPLVIEEMGRIIYADLDSKAAPRRFETLQCIWLNLDEWGWFPAGSILPFLELPQLKSLTLGAWGGAKSRDEKRCDLYGDARKWPLRTSTIEEVYLYEVFAEPSMVSLDDPLHCPSMGRGSRRPQEIFFQLTQTQRKGYEATRFLRSVESVRVHGINPRRAESLAMAQTSVHCSARSFQQLGETVHCGTIVYATAKIQGLV